MTVGVQYQLPPMSIDGELGLSSLLKELFDLILLLLQSSSLSIIKDLKYLFQTYLVGGCGSAWCNLNDYRTKCWYYSSGAWNTCADLPIGTNAPGVVQLNGNSFMMCSGQIVGNKNCLKNF